MGSPFGKFTEELKTLVDEPTLQAWLQLCHQKSVTSSELLRDYVYLLVHGKTPAELAADDRRALLTAEGRNEARSRIGGRG